MYEKIESINNFDPTNIQSSQNYYYNYNRQDVIQSYPNLNINNFYGNNYNDGYNENELKNLNEELMKIREEKEKNYRKSILNQKWKI